MPGVLQESKLTSSLSDNKGKDLKGYERHAGAGLKTVLPLYGAKIDEDEAHRSLLFGRNSEGRNASISPEGDKSKKGGPTKMELGQWLTP